MATGSTSNSSNKQKRRTVDTTLGTEPPKIEPFVPRSGYNPKELKSWAKKTGFVSDYSEEASTASGVSRKFQSLDVVDHRRYGDELSPKIEIDPILGRTRPKTGIYVEPGSGSSSGRGNRAIRGDNWRGTIGNEFVVGKNESETRNVNAGESETVNANEHGVPNIVPVVTFVEPKKEEEKGEIDVENGFTNQVSVGEDSASHSDEDRWNDNKKSAVFKCGLRDNPGIVPLIYYGLQHYLSLAGSLIFIPLVIVPAMGGTDKDTATVISTMLLVSGITTILHSYFGTRLPLVQGGSFVYLAPALVILNARENRNLSEHKFRHIMNELQGAIIVGSIFQCLLGFSGLMSLLLRLINPVVVAPTIAAVGLAFFSYGFPQAGTCMEISIPQILLLIVFTLYLRGISVYGHRMFQIYAVPLSVMIIWIYASFLTAGGAYNYKGCSPDIPSSNILVDSCRKHAYTMKHCRTDVSNAWRTVPWVRIPYPFQWGLPVLRFRSSMIMIFVSLIASVDSVGTYHCASLLVTSKPPTPGIVSRGIGLEGFCSILAGLWGIGTGSTTLTENVQTINVTKVASRKALQLGAVFLILFSFNMVLTRLIVITGKIGAILASIPQALAVSVLCFVWGLIVALGLSNLQYGQAASFRNMTVVGASLFLGLSIPAYFYQFQPETSLILPSYFLPFSAASDGPVHTGNKQLDFAINAIMSLNMVVTFLVAFVLDNTVPGSRQERGVYEWSRPEDLAANPSLHADYSLPRKLSFLECSSWYFARVAERGIA
ncbi:hypothetical protein ACFE04_016312 [Oxalis oulophora]